MFLPANTTALVQPMDQGVLEAMKRRYRKALLQRKTRKEDPLLNSVRKSTKDVVHTTAAWDDIPALMLASLGANLRK